MKHLAVIISLSVLFTCRAQFFDPDRPMIVPFIVCVDSINDQMHDNMRKPPHSKITETNGWVEIPNTYYQHNGKSLGIILAKTGTYAYAAFDARCPHCFYDDANPDSKIKMYSRLSAVCEVCSAEAQGLINVGASSITRYDHGNLAPAKMNTYLVKEIKRGKKTFLKIYNAFNGVSDEWRSLPENKFLIGKDIFE